MIQLFYSEDRDVCTYPKGYRFEYVRLLMDKEDHFWIEGKGYLGCVTKLQISDEQVIELLRIRNAGLIFEERK